MEIEVTRSMNLVPRLPSSKKWTGLPAELIVNLENVFKEEFKPEAQYGEFLIEGRIYPEELILRVGYLEKGRLKQVNFEASIDLPKPDSKTTQNLSEESNDSEEKKESAVMQRLYSCVDALGGLMEEYFQIGDDTEMDIPERWTPFEFEGETLYLQRSSYNTKLEEEADRLLGLLDNRLVHEETPSEDALENAEVNSELAFQIQKEIRSGKYTLRPENPEEDPKAEQK